MNETTTWQQDAAKVLNALAKHEGEPPVAGSATGSAAACELEVVPKFVTTLADAYEQGKVVMGGRRAGRTWAMRIATAKPHQKQLPQNDQAERTG